MSGARSLGYAEARSRVLDRAPALPSGRVSLQDAAGRALRETVRAPHPLPPFRNSAMDGFAVRCVDLAGATEENPVTLAVIDVIAAGRMESVTVRAGQAARIMTGAPLPAGADAIVPFEEAERAQSHAGREAARFRHAAHAADHVREAGTDAAAGEVVLEQGRELSAWDIAVLAALGLPEVHVSPRVRVAVLSTGDELLDIDAPLRPGGIRDSNLPMLSQLVRDSGGVVTLAARLPDDADRVADAVRQARADNDVVLTIGGVSAGDFDPVKQAVASLADVELWRVSMRPGRPQAFGAQAGRLFFGLPGNPASVACVFEVLVRPALRALQGFAVLDRPRAPVRAACAVDSRAGRTDFVRAQLSWRDDALWAEPAGAQVSGHLLPQSRAHGLLVVPEGAPRLETGDASEAIVWRLPEAR